MPRRAVQAALTAAVVGGTMIAMASPAAAATLAPSCVSRMVTETTDGFDVLLWNKCSGTQSVKVDVSLASDSPCYVMSKGTSKLFVYHGILGTYTRTLTC
ncbi:beta-Ig-H3/fasciclin [Streptomyces sp. OR43]|uniref:beta-Ig-H3/fasciclin n=1 Tax=Streptomyces sp. or43 TaxID=2478957 RepID=UPI0021C5E267|nr:beta-Ig-H3/fasciclin [Streptomyces sp. or43]